MMKLKKYFNSFSSLRNLKIEDIRWSSLVENIPSTDLTVNNFNQLLVRVLSPKRNRIIISSGVATIILLSIIPSDIELVLNRKSTLSQFQTEESLLDDLELELARVVSQLELKNDLKSKIFELIPSHDYAEKALPIILTNLLNSSSLRLIEILPINESSYLSDSDEDSLLELDSYLDDPNSDEEFILEDDLDEDIPQFPDEDPESSALDNFDDSDFALDDDPINDTVPDTTEEGVITSLYYSVKLQGDSIGIYEFFDKLHSTKLINSIGLVSFGIQPDASNRNVQGISPIGQPQLLDVSFTLKIAVNSSNLQSLDNVNRSYSPSSLPEDPDSFLDAGFWITCLSPCLDLTLLYYLRIFHLLPMSIEYPHFRFLIHFKTNKHVLLIIPYFIVYCSQSLVCVEKYRL